MNVSFDPSQGDNTDVFHNLDLYRGWERTPEDAACSLLLEVKQSYPDKQEAWVENGGTA